MLSVVVFQALFSVQVVTMNNSRNQKCTIVSLNVRGIRDQVKRRSIFSYLKDQKASFYFLQETFSETSDETIWKKEWGGNIIFSHGSRQSRGVCILIDPIKTRSDQKLQSRLQTFDGPIIPSLFDPLRHTDFRKWYIVCFIGFVLFCCSPMLSKAFVVVQ